MLLARGLQREAEQVRLCRLALWCPCRDGAIRNRSGILALKLSTCLCVLQGTAARGKLIIALCFSWELPKSQSSGSAAPAEGSVGHGPLKKAALSWGKEAEAGLLSLPRAARCGRLGRPGRETLSSTVVGCASWQIDLM